MNGLAPAGGGGGAPPPITAPATWAACSSAVTMRSAAIPNAVRIACSSGPIGPTARAASSSPRSSSSSSSSSRLALDVLSKDRMRMGLVATKNCLEEMTLCCCIAMLLSTTCCVVGKGRPHRGTSFMYLNGYMHSCTYDPTAALESFHVWTPPDTDPWNVYVNEPKCYTFWPTYNKQVICHTRVRVRWLIVV